MKIIDRETFKRMPKGTVFCKFPRFDERTRTYCNYLFSIQEPCVLSGPFDADFGYTPVGSLEACAADDDTSNMAILVDMERHPGKEYPFEHWTGRDGMYEENDQVGFAIYSRQEVQQMIDLLQQALKDGYSDSPDVADSLDDITQPPCDMKFHDGVVVEIDGERHVLEPVKDTGRNGSCAQCSLDEVCDRFKNALCNGLAGYDDDHIFVRQEH